MTSSARVDGVRPPPRPRGDAFSSAQAAQKARAPSKTLAAGLYASGAVAFLASAVAAATTGARGLAPFATLVTFALVCVKA